MGRKPQKPKVGVPEPEKKLDRDRSWETRQRQVFKPITFRKVPAEITEQANAIANEHYVVRDEVFRVFWDYAYQGYLNGEIALAPTLEKGRLTLFPENHD